MKLRCDYCGGKLGLILHRHGNKRFCSNKQNKKCKERFLNERPAMKPWLDQFFNMKIG